MRVLLDVSIFIAVAAGYAFVAWRAAARFGPKVLWLTWVVGSVLLTAYLLLVAPVPPGTFPGYVSWIQILAVALAFALSTNSVRRYRAASGTSESPPLGALARATGAFFAGFLLGLLPLLVLDIVAVAHPR